MIHNSKLTQKEKNLYGSQLSSAMAYLALRQLYSFRDTRPMEILFHAPTETEG